MKYIKYFTMTVILVLCFFMAQSVFAEDVTFDTVKVYFTKTDIPTLVEGDVVFEIYDGNNLLDTKIHSLKRENPGFEIEFNVPEYEAGKTFRFHVKEGAQGAHHSGTYSRDHILQTYSMPDENGTLQYQTSFYMDLIPNWNKEAIITIPGVNQTLFYHCLTEEDVFVTTDLLDVLGIVCTKNFDAEKPGFTLSSEDGKYVAQFYVDDIYATFGGIGENLSSPAFLIGEMPYVPLSRVAEYFACNYELTEENRYCRKISLTKSEYSQVLKEEEYVNSLDITSKTDYLVWVDKSEYTVNVFLGTNKNWRLIESFPCAIGAPSTPTIEGRFEYYQQHDRWQYDGYYCGPIMRFRGGYALHSVLLKNDGSFYDGRVGVKISHGCVRLLPDDINWMISYVPLYTRILVTA